MEKLKNLKYHTSQKKQTLVFPITCSKYKNDDEKIFKEEESIVILKTLGLLKIYKYFKNMSQEFWLKKYR